MGTAEAVNVIKAGYLKDIESDSSRTSRPARPLLSKSIFSTPDSSFSIGSRSVLRGSVQATKTPAGVIVAAKVDPRFAKDKEYPNESRVINKNALGNPVLRPPQPYSGAGFYAKVTRLIEPANAIFVEFHEVFYEPQAWFAPDDNLMPANLKKIIPYQVKEFRRSSCKATEDPGREEFRRGKAGGEVVLLPRQVARDRKRYPLS